MIDINKLEKKKASYKEIKNGADISQITYFTNNDVLGGLKIEGSKIKNGFFKKDTIKVHFD